MRHERHGTGTNIENYISVGLLNVKDVKKKTIFFRFMLFHKGSTKGGHGFKKIFIFK